MNYNFSFEVTFTHKQYVIVGKFLGFKPDNRGSQLAYPNLDKSLNLFKFQLFLETKQK